MENQSDGVDKPIRVRLLAGSRGRALGLSSFTRLPCLIPQSILLQLRRSCHAPGHARSRLRSHPRSRARSGAGPACPYRAVRRARGAGPFRQSGDVGGTGCLPPARLRRPVGRSDRGIGPLPARCRLRGPGRAPRRLCRRHRCRGERGRADRTCPLPASPGPQGQPGPLGAVPEFGRAHPLRRGVHRPSHVFPAGRDQPRFVRCRFRPAGARIRLPPPGAPDPSGRVRRGQPGDRSRPRRAGPL